MKKEKEKFVAALKTQTLQGTFVPGEVLAKYRKLEFAARALPGLMAHRKQGPQVGIFLKGVLVG